LDRYVVSLSLSLSLSLLWSWSNWPNVSSELSRTPQQRISESWFGLVGSTSESYYWINYRMWKYLGEILGFQVWFVWDVVASSLVVLEYLTRCFFPSFPKQPNSTTHWAQQRDILNFLFLSTASCSLSW
jgi:hypothetical protein